MGAARGEGHQARCFAWAAAYLLTGERLPGFAMGRRVTAIGAQTGRAVDDLALLTDEDGWVLIQAKKGLRLTASPGGDLAAALGQAARLDVVSPERPVDPERDRVLIVSDETAARTVARDLRSVVDRLRTLPTAVPLDAAARNQDERTGLALLRQHLGTAWQAAHGSAMSEVDFRTVCRSLGVQVLDLSDGGSHRTAAEQLLRTLLPAGDVAALWELLVAEGHRIAQEGAYVDRDELARRLAALGVVLSPVSRLGPDIQRLRDRTTTNLDLLGRGLVISAPDGVVDVERAAVAHLAAAGGNIAITGGSGTGKSTELHRAAVALRRRGLDVVLLRADDLRGTEGRTRQELNLDHDLADVLLSWSGPDGATLMLDGLDQTRGEDVSAWLSAVAHRLACSRWRIVATIRSYDLRNSRRWRGVFDGTPVDPAHADPALAAYRHLCLGDFTDAEIALASAQSARLGALLDSADPGVRSLLANPFNLDVTAQLLGSGELDLAAVHGRIDLLHQFWQVHAYRHDTARVVVLRALVHRRVATGRQAAAADVDGVDGTDGIDGIDHAVLRSLCSDGVLRELPLVPGQAAPAVEFTHPVLFDYAVALFSLGDPARPGSLVDVLGERPNLAVVLRASIEFRLAMVWRRDESRAEFWRLGARLATRDGGHPLVAVPAARIAVSELRTADECAAVADLCLSGRPSAADGAGQLAYLVAVLAGRGGAPAVVEVVAALAGDLAARAGRDGNLAVARLAAEMSRELAGHAGPELDERLAAVAADCAGLALAHREHATSPRVAEAACQVLGRVVAVVGHRGVEVIRELCGPDVLRSWGGAHLRGLIDRSAEVARVDSELAATVCATAWHAETDRLEFAVHGVRSDVGRAFAALADVDLTAATTLLLAVLRGDRGPGRWWIIESPAPSGPVRTMTVAWTARVRRHDDLWARLVALLEPDEKAALEQAVQEVERAGHATTRGDDDPDDLDHLLLVEGPLSALVDAWPGPMDDATRLLSPPDWRTRPRCRRTCCPAPASTRSCGRSRSRTRPP
jgi:hypothetical protein